MSRPRRRHVLYASLVLIPVDVALRLIGADDILLFCVSTVALVPLAYVIGEATEHASEHTGPGIAGLLNASFGNAPELIIALFSADRGLFGVVRGSLTGSVVSNLLLVLGVSVLVARRGRVQRRSCGLWLGLTLFGLLLLIVPASQYWGGQPARHVSAWGSLVSAVLLVTYAVVTTWSVVRQKREYREVKTSGERGPAAGDGAWSMPVSLAALALATLGTVAVSETLTASIGQFAARVGWSDFFVAAVLVALAGNATEHGAAVLVARRGRLDLAGEISFSSAAQVATMVVPAVALLSLAFNPLPLAFRPAELAGIAFAVLIPGLMLGVRQVRWGWGVLLCAAYCAVAAAFYVVG